MATLGVFPEWALKADRLGPPTGAVHCRAGVRLRKSGAGLGREG